MRSVVAAVAGLGLGLASFTWLMLPARASVSRAHVVASSAQPRTLTLASPRQLVLGTVPVPSTLARSPETAASLAAPIDATDPWLDAPASTARTVVPRPRRPADTIDPWSGKPTDAARIAGSRLTIDPSDPWAR